MQNSNTMNPNASYPTPRAWYDDLVYMDKSPQSLPPWAAIDARIEERKSDRTNKFENGVYESTASYEKAFICPLNRLRWHSAILGETAMMVKMAHAIMWEAYEQTSSGTADPEYSYHEVELVMENALDVIQGCLAVITDMASKAPAGSTDPEADREMEEALAWRAAGEQQLAEGTD